MKFASRCSTDRPRPSVFSVFLARETASIQRFRVGAETHGQGLCLRARQTRATHAPNPPLAKWNALSKSLKTYRTITAKNTNAAVAMVRDARCRPTCEHASKRDDFCRSRFCFAHVMVQKSLKIVENNRWGPVMCRRSCPPRGGPIRSVLGK